jgi:hypothetical protein
MAGVPMPAYKQFWTDKLLSLNVWQWNPSQLHTYAHLHSLYTCYTYRSYLGRKWEFMVCDELV